jgi:hypothetical protein
LKRLVYIIILLAVVSSLANSQGTDRNRLIQVNGIITDDDNHPVPHVSIISTRLRRGTVSEMTGIYSLISMPGDTVFVSALGFKKITFQVPVAVEGRLYKRDIALVSDTISIEGVNIFPWKNYQEFKREVLANQPVMKPELRFMYENLANIRTTIANTPAYSASPEAAYRLSMNQQADNVVTHGQTPVNNILNPIAWAKFFNGVKGGLLKNQETTTTTRKAKVKKKKPARE